MCPADVSPRETSAKCGGGVAAERLESTQTYILASRLASRSLAAELGRWPDTSEVSLRSLLPWSIVSLVTLLPTVFVHNWANAQRPITGRAVVRAGSRRWWFPWPRRSEFPDARTWQVARAAQVAMYVWSVAMLVAVVLEFVSLRAEWRAG